MTDHSALPVGAGLARDAVAFVGAGRARDKCSHGHKRCAGGARSHRVRVLGVFFAACLLSACVSQEPRQLVPSITLSPEVVSMSEGEAVGTGLNFGLTATVNESDSLSNITVLPGIRVRAVAANGAADTAGIRAGDVVLSIDGRDQEVYSAVTNRKPNGDGRWAQGVESRRRYINYHRWGYSPI